MDKIEAIEMLQGDLEKHLEFRMPNDVGAGVKFVNIVSDFLDCACASKAVESVPSASTNKPSAKPCAWCCGRIANKGAFANYCPMCGFDLRTASHIG